MNNILNEIVIKDKKWEFTKQDNGLYTITYYEYFESLKQWQGISKRKNVTENDVMMIQKYEF